MLFRSCMGIAQGLQPLIGYHYGAKKLDRMKKLVLITIGVCVVGGILVYTSIVLYGREMIQIFGIGSENIEFAYDKIILYCIGSPFIGTIFTMSGYYQAIGRNIYANIISIGRGFVFQFLFTIILPPLIGSTGVFLSLPLAELITLIIIVFILFREKDKNLRAI